VAARAGHKWRSVLTTARPVRVDSLLVVLADGRRVRVRVN
jgi:hypothetical protein